MDWIATLNLPNATLAGGKPIPKTVLIAQGGLTKTEEKLLKQYSRLTHIATIQRATARIAPVLNSEYEIGSVIYLRCELVKSGGFGELASALHKVFPNPIVLLFEEPGGKVGVSVSLKRKSHAEKGAVVVERIESARLFDPSQQAFADYLEDIRHGALPQSDLLAYVCALCDRTAKAAAIASIGEYPHCKDADTAQLMALLVHLRDTQSEINVLQSQYRDKEATLAESSRLRMALKRKEREHDRFATEIKELCHG
ncbi:MAG: DUF4391 domain-containing protein [Coriobacteriales bacterium]|nr:DUF4391 domain-containing protein [Coriobacteriales bacterium]